jgi:hypothetical protein
MEQLSNVLRDQPIAVQRACSAFSCMQLQLAVGAARVHLRLGVR